MASLAGIAAARSTRSLAELSLSTGSTERAPHRPASWSEDAVKVALDEGNRKGHRHKKDEEAKEGGGGDKLVNDYISFIAMMRTQGKSTEEYQKEVSRLQSELADGSSDGSVESSGESFSGRISVEEESSAVALAGSSGGLSFAGVGVSSHLSAEFEFDVRTEDGTTVHVEGSMEVSFQATAVVVQGQQQPQKSDPLLLDLSGDGQYSLSGVDDGFLFDINGDGALDHTGFVRGGDVALALDRNGNGRIDDGSELFGDQHGAANGFAELAKFDDDGNGRIDASDSIYSQLVGVSANANGGLDVRSLQTLGVEAIELGYRDGSMLDVNGNTLAEEGSFVRSNGQKGRATDALFAYVTPASGDTLASHAKLVG